MAFLKAEQTVTCGIQLVKEMNTWRNRVLSQHFISRTKIIKMYVRHDV